MKTRKENQRKSGLNHDISLIVGVLELLDDILTPKEAVLVRELREKQGQMIWVKISEDIFTQYTLFELSKCNRFFYVIEIDEPIETFRYLNI